MSFCAFGTSEPLLSPAAPRLGIIGIIRMVGVFPLDFDPLNRQRPACFRIDLGQRAAKPNVAGGDVEGLGHVGGHVFDHAILAAAEDRVIGAGHAQIADVAGAIGKDAGVGGGDVRMGAEDKRAAPVEPMAHRDLLAGGLGMHVADADAHLAGNLLEHAVGGGEGIVRREIHVDAPQQTEDGDADAAVGRDDGKGAARRVGGQVRGSDDALAAFQRGDDIELFVDMVAERDDIDAVGAQLVKEVLRDAASPGDVLGVGDHQIDRMLADDRRQPLMHHLPARPSDDITQAKNAKRHGRAKI